MKNNLLFSSSELSPESYIELLPIFFEEITDDFNSLKAAFHQKELDETRRLAHKIKGCAASYAADEISAKALKLQVILETENADGSKAIVEELETAIHLSHEFAVSEFGIN